MKLKITVHGVAYEVDVEVLDAGEGFPAAVSLPRPRANSGGAAPASAAPRTAPSVSPRGTDGGAVTSPIAGTVVELKCKVGDVVKESQVLLIIEAMKMKTSIAAPTAGKVKTIPVAVGDAVREGQILVELE